MRLLFAVLAAVALAACECGGGGGSGGGAGGGGGGGGAGGGTGGGGAPRFTSYELDPGAVALDGHAIAVDRARNRVGVAYFADVDGGTEREVRFVEWRDGTVSAPETWRTVQRTKGIAIAYQPSGEPAVAYLGGGSDSSLFWTESDVEIAYRQNGTWTKVVPFTMSGQIATGACNNPISSVGFVVGLSPALAFTPAGRTYLAFRDVHGGSSLQQDWGGSDLKLAEGVNPNWMGTCIAPSATAKAGVGNHNVITIGPNDQPAIAFDLDPGGTGAGDGPVYLTRRDSSGSWSAPVELLSPGNTGSGPALAYDADGDGGFGLATGDLSGNKVTFRHSNDGLSWTTPETVYGSGTGGWNASLAFDPGFGEAAIAYYVCSQAPMKAEGDCPDAEIRVNQRRAGVWDDGVEVEGPFAHTQASLVPKLGFIAPDKRVVVYPMPPGNHLRLAIEN